VTAAHGRPGRAAEELIAENRKARHDFFIEEVYECGLVLTGSEVKSLREHRVNLRDSHARTRNGELLLYNMHIAAYAPAGRFGHAEKRPRKLLMHRREIERLSGRVRERGYSLVPLRIYFSRGLAKIELALAKGKRLFDKREALARKAARREIERLAKARQVR
jgi:SsrA-binding protein